MIGRERYPGGEVHSGATVQQQCRDINISVMSSDVKWSEAALLREDGNGEEGIKRIRGGATERRNTIYLRHMLGKSEIDLSKHATC